MLHRALHNKLKVGKRWLPSSPSLTQNSVIPLITGHPLNDHQSCRQKSRFAYPEGMKSVEDDWTEVPEYPEIDPETHDWCPRRKERRQKVLDRHEKIKNCGSPEEKIFEYNYPYQYGFKNFRIQESNFDYDSLNAYKFITRTNVASTDKLPSHYYSSPEMKEKVQHFKEKIKEPLADVLAFELDLHRSLENEFNATPQQIEYHKSLSLIPQINRVILSVLGPEVDYLKDCAVDVKPNVEAFWEVGGLQPSYTRRNQREGLQKLPDRSKWKLRHIKPDSPVEHHMHYVGETLLQMRCKDPPENFVHPEDPLCKRSLEEIPEKFPHFLQAYGFHYPDEYRYRHCSIIPGHWSTDQYRCNLLAFHGRHHLKHSDRFGNKLWDTQEENEESLLSQAMLVSFGRLLAQALYHGFDEFNDLLYPFSTQTIITNGTEWSFFNYQLNTIRLGGFHHQKNHKMNVIWGTKTQSIYDKETPGKLNDAVLENILQFYLNHPRKIALENPTPYLNPERAVQVPWSEDEEEDKKRIIMFFNYRYMISQKIYRTDALRYRRPPEMYDWEKMYKFVFKMRPMEKRMRYFELPTGFPGSQPWKDTPFRIVDPLHLGKGIEWNIRLSNERLEARRQKEEKIKEAIKHRMISEKDANKKLS